MGWTTGIILGLILGLAGPAVAETGLTIDVKSPLPQASFMSCKDCYWSRYRSDIRFAKRLECAEKGNPECQLLVARHYAELQGDGPETGENRDLALLWLNKAIAVRHAPAYVLMAEAYGQGPEHAWKLGLPKSPKKQVEWLEAAAGLGDIRSMERLATSYIKGEFTPVDDAKSLYWLDKIPVRMFSSTAARTCAWLDERGEWPRAEAFCLRARKRLDRDAAYRLGVAAETGKGRTVDLKQAANLYAEALPEARATDALQRLEKTGIYDSHAVAVNLTWLKDVQAVVAQARQYEAVDKDEAARFYLFAAAQGNAEAQAWLKAHPEVTPATIAERETDFSAIPTVFKGYGTARDGHMEVLPMAEAIRRSIQMRSIHRYPPRALDAEIEGQSVVQCRWSRKGWLENCLILSQPPQGYGFGASALYVLGFPVAMDSPEVWAKTYAGKVATFRIHWKIDTGY